MKVDVTENEIGLGIGIRDGRTQLDDLQITMTGLISCAGRTGRQNGVSMECKEFISMTSSMKKLKQAGYAAKKATPD